MGFETQDPPILLSTVLDWHWAVASLNFFLLFLNANTKLKRMLYCHVASDPGSL